MRVRRRCPGIFTDNSGQILCNSQNRSLKFLLLTLNMGLPTVFISPKNPAHKTCSKSTVKTFKSAALLKRNSIMFAFHFVNFFPGQLFYRRRFYYSYKNGWKLFNNRPIKICGRQPLKKLKWYGLPTSNFLKTAFYKFYLAYSWIPWPKCPCH